MTGVLTQRQPVGEEHPEPAAPVAGRGLRRFVVSVTAALAVVTVPFLWVLWDLWTGGVNALRSVAPSNFYELQARAMFHGHLWVPRHSLGLEAFDHAGHQYTYFGIFPSILRMPVLAFTSSLDGRLTAPALLLAWVATGVASAGVIWRLRVMVRGDVLLGRAEAASYGLLVAALTGGSVLLYLGATPYVYNEDFAWSVVLTLASMFALLGVVERRSVPRVAWAGFFILLANLNRSPTGYACTIGALLVAGWLGWGKAGRDRRRWAVAVALAGLFGLAAQCVVTYLKFGLPFGLPMASQVWTHLDAHRRYFLKANGGKAFSVAFLPTTLWAYLQPFGLRLQSAFPWITLPAAPARAIGGVVLDQTYETDSVTASMPLLFLLSCWGLVSVFRPKVPKALSATRPVVLAAGSAVTGVVLWGYIAERYLADFLPLLAVASTIGLLDLWRRVDQRAGRPAPAHTPGRLRAVMRRRLSGRRVLVGLVALGTLFGVAANLGASISPKTTWTPAQVERFVTAQNDISHASLVSSLRHGSTLPLWGPAQQLFVVGSCSGLYLSTGDRFGYAPGQQIEHATWIPVEQQAGFNHVIDITDEQPITGPGPAVPLLTYGKTLVVVEPVAPGRVGIIVEHPGGPHYDFPGTVGPMLPLPRYGVLRIHVMTDPNLHAIEVAANGQMLVNHYLAGTGPAQVDQSLPWPAGHPPQLVVTDVTGPPPAMPLCHSLTGGR